MKHRGTTIKDLEDLRNTPDRGGKGDRLGCNRELKGGIMVVPAEVGDTFIESSGETKGSAYTALIDLV